MGHMPLGATSTDLKLIHGAIFLYIDAFLKLFFIATSRFYIRLGIMETQLMRTFSDEKESEERVLE